MPNLGVVFPQILTISISKKEAICIKPVSPVINLSDCFRILADCKMLKPPAQFTMVLFENASSSFDPIFASFESPSNAIGTLI